MSNIYEGFIVQDTTPQAFALAESWKAKIDELNAREEIEHSAIIVALEQHQKEIIKAFGHMERAVNLNAGKVITA